MPEELIAQEKLDALQKKSPLPPDIRLWIETFVYSIIILVVVGGYYAITADAFTLRILNRVVADVALLLMGMSMMLSALCYFWNFADRLIIYRKHVGLVGFGYLLVHVVLSLFLSEYTPFAEYYLADTRIVSFVAALLATIIFTVMAAISNKWAIHEIGPQRWRKILRLGYIGFILALIHFGWRGLRFWTPWLLGESDSLLPSFGLIVFVFGLIVILLRLALWIATNRASTSTSQA